MNVNKFSFEVKAYRYASVVSFVTGKCLKNLNQTLAAWLLKSDARNLMLQINLSICLWFVLTVCNDICNENFCTIFYVLISIDIWY